MLLASLSASVLFQHINKKINTANRVLGTIRRTFSYLDKDNFNQLHKSLVSQEFANQMWASNLKKHIEALENIQRRATRMLPGMKELAYPYRLHKLKLLSVAYTEDSEGCDKEVQDLDWEIRFRGQQLRKAVRSSSEHTRPFLEDCQVQT